MGLERKQCFIPKKSYFPVAGRSAMEGNHLGSSMGTERRKTPSPVIDRASSIICLLAGLE